MGFVLKGCMTHNLKQKDFPFVEFVPSEDSSYRTAILGCEDLKFSLKADSLNNLSTLDFPDMGFVSIEDNHNNQASLKRIIL
jgi:hypothetical protein